MVNEELIKCKNLKPGCLAVAKGVHLLSKVKED